MSPDEITMPPSVLGGLIGQRPVNVADIGGASTQGRARRRNEDAWGYAAGQAFVVADGMGGRTAGDLAAQIVVQTLLQELAGDIGDWRQAIRTVNEAVCAAANDNGVGSLGAVAVALRCVNGRVTIVHVGDARAYRLRDGQVQQLTRDHSIAEAIADLGIRRSDSGLPGRDLHALTSYFGSPGSAEEFTVHELTVRQGDRIVLCSDGVHGSVDRATWQAAGELPTAGETAPFLTAQASARGARDDCTALVLDLDVTVPESGRAR